jgi:hypothetical protein
MGSGSSIPRNRKPVPRNRVARRRRAAFATFPIENRLCEYARIILQDASIETPKRRAGHNDDLNNWIAPAPRDRVGERNRIMHKANEQAPQRNERARWKMPPLIRSIKLEDETIVRFGDVEGRGRPH